MALSRRSGKRFEANIWPGFVDAMTALLLVLVFVLSIFMIVQFMLRETISTQDVELDELGGQVQSLADALGLEQQRGSSLEQQVDQLDEALRVQLTEAEQQTALIASLTSQTENQQNRISSFEEQVAGLISQRDALTSERDSLTTARDTLVAERDGLATARDALAAERDGLATARDALTAERDGLVSERDALVSERETVEGELDAARVRSDLLTARISEIEVGLAREISEKEAAQLALASVRDEIDVADEQARLAAAQREALEAMVANLELERDTQAAQLSDAETARLANSATAQALQDQLKDADAELTAMTLNLEAQRREAEDTLTLLAAARSANTQIEAQLADALGSAEASAADVERAQAELEASGQTQTQLRAELALALALQQATREEAGTAVSEAEEREALLNVARQELSAEREINQQGVLKVEALNLQITELRTQLSSLQALLDESGARDQQADVQIETLGSELNAALAQVASEQRRVADEQRKLAAEQSARAEEQARIAQLEAAERARLEEEAKELQSYRSEFFGQLRELLGDQDGVRIEGDRFVFSSEVLFQPGAANLSSDGQAEIAKVANILLSVAGDIPTDLDWVIRVDGHTDNIPLGGRGRFSDNWELSQARALSVVRYMSGALGIPPNRLAANGFGEFQPVNPADTPEARAQNRRIELKLTEK